jgi:uncharacterized membrane protein
MNKRWLGLIFVAASLIFSLAVYNDLPERVATHFGVNGQPDGWSSRGVAAFGIPLAGLLMFGLFHGLPRILPRRENFERFEDTYWAITTLVLAFVFAMHVVVLGMALGWPVDMPTFVVLGVGSMFVILGNLMPRVKQNWLLGIRTPWTLESESVWRETHRIGGRTMVLGGLITMMGVFCPTGMQPWIAMVGLGVGAFIPLVYSYILWRREQRTPVR